MDKILCNVKHGILQTQSSSLHTVNENLKAVLDDCYTDYQTW